MRLRYFFCAALALATCGRAEAGYQFQFATDTGTAASAFTIDYGVQTFVDVRVYLQATGATDINTLRTTGLESYGVRLNWTTPVYAQVLNTGAITGNAAFDGGDSKSVTGTSATINGVVGFAPTTEVKAGATEDRILLATFRFSGIANGTTTTLTVDPNAAFGFDNTVLAGGSAIDALIANSSATITVQNVPEPGTLALGGLLAAGLVGARLRRRAVAV